MEKDEKATSKAELGVGITFNIMVYWKLGEKNIYINLLFL